MSDSSERINRLFLEKFDIQPEVVMKSPGRVNIIGEHTDYNDGFVLPAAINYYMYLALTKNGSNQINILSADYDEWVEIDLNVLDRGDNAWLNLIKGVIYQIREKIGGFNLVFGGDVPVGAGVSSSAALCCGLASGLSELFGLGLDKWSLAKIAQKSEHDFSLVQCGIMDQFACLFGREDHVLLLNCKTLEYEESPVDITGCKFILINSNVQHSLGDSDYNNRRKESEEAFNEIKKNHEYITSYQDVNELMVSGLEEKTYWKRAMHIMMENKRVHQMRDALENKDFEKIGSLLTNSHLSLKNYYAVTCEETDFLVNELNTFDEVFGARQLGGGFGGCVLALTKDNKLDNVINTLGRSYKKQFSLELDIIPIRSSRGCHRIV